MKKGKNVRTTETATDSDTEVRGRDTDVCDTTSTTTVTAQETIIIAQDPICNPPITAPTTGTPQENNTTGTVATTVEPPKKLRRTANSSAGTDNATGEPPKKTRNKKPVSPPESINDSVEKFTEYVVFRSGFENSAESEDFTHALLEIRRQLGWFRWQEAVKRVQEEDDVFKRRQNERETTKAEKDAELQKAVSKYVKLDCQRKWIANVVKIVRSTLDAIDDERRRSAAEKKFMSVMGIHR